MPGDIASMSVWNTISVLFRDKQWEWLVFTTICDEQYGGSAFRVGNFVQTRKCETAWVQDLPFDLHKDAH